MLSGSRSCSCHQAGHKAVDVPAAGELSRPLGHAPPASLEARRYSVLLQRQWTGRITVTRQYQGQYK